MKQQVLKALANPARIFYVPYSLAIINFAACFIIYLIIAVTLLPIIKDFISPLYFLIPMSVIHLILAAFSKKDPQLGQIIAAKLKLMKNRVPRRLPV